MDHVGTLPETNDVLSLTLFGIVCPPAEKEDTVKNLLKPSYGRPFFVCSDQSNPCSFWTLGDVRPIAKPECRHGFPCVICKVKKEGINKDRLFFRLFFAQENSCKYFEWVPAEPYYDAKFFRPITKRDEKHEEQYLTNDFIKDLTTALKI